MNTLRNILPLLAKTELLRSNRRVEERGYLTDDMGTMCSTPPSPQLPSGMLATLRQHGSDSGHGPLEEFRRTGHPLSSWCGSAEGVQPARKSSRSARSRRSSALRREHCYAAFSSSRRRHRTWIPGSISGRPRGNLTGGGCHASNRATTAKRDGARLEEQRFEFR